MNRILPLLFLLAAVAGCDSTGAAAEDDLLVVEAFLYAGEPVSDVRLTESVPLTSEDDATPVSDADVRLFKGDAVYVLTPSDSAGYYHYAGTDLAVEARDTFRLEIESAGRTVTAETVVPAPPVGVTLSDSVLEVATFSGAGPGMGGVPGGGGPGQIEQNTLTVSWDNPSAALHYVVVESLVTEDPEYIQPEFFRDRFGGFRFITEPTDLAYFEVNAQSLEVLGPHRVVVYRVNGEYADLYENREQDSRDLNEPPTNVTGGLGVFSAFNSQSAVFEVVAADE